MHINTHQLEIILKSTLSSLVGHPVGSHEFNILVLAGLVGLAFFGKLLNTWVGGSSRGFIGTAIGLALPCAVGVMAFAMAKIYVPQYVGNPALHENVEFAVAIALGVFTLFLITPLFLGTGIIKSTLVFAISIAAAIGITHMTTKGVESFSKGQKNTQRSSRKTTANYDAIQRSQESISKYNASDQKRLDYRD